ncbi:hypothetical protein D5E75_23330 [Vibrio parahaemolyticus]|nr:hypothetical protein D5E75_23330 [Vibrio parahaemolyticus]
MIFPTQSEFNKLSETPSENASAETHVPRAISRAHYRDNSTFNVMIDGEKLEEFYKQFKQQRAEIKALKETIAQAKSLLENS